MRKAIALVILAAICMSLAVPAMASGKFVPSITYKGAPEFAEVEEPGAPENTVGVVRTPEGKTTDFVSRECLGMATVATVKNADMPEDAREEFQMVYKQLEEGTMVLPYEKAEGIDPEKMVIRELMDLRWLCTGHDHETALAQEDASLELTFDIRLGQRDVIVVMVLVDGEWILAKEAVNNGDGTVTVRLPQLGITVFAVEN